MGTRSTTRVLDEDNRTTLVNMYGQYDGYPSGHGRELVDFLKGIRLVNGNTGRPGEANGIHCLAGQIIAHFKKGIGTYYLFPASNEQEWNYIVYVSKDTIPQIRLRVKNSEGTVFDGYAGDFDPDGY